MADRTENDAARHRYSIRIQFTIIFFFLMLGAIGSSWIVNSTFLERYYIREKKIALKQMYDAVNEAVNNNSIDSDEFDDEVMRRQYVRKDAFHGRRGVCSEPVLRISCSGE